MSKLSPQKIEAAIEDGFSLNISEYVSEAWEIFKTNAGGFIGFIIMLGIIRQVLGRITGAGDIFGAILSPIFYAGFFVVCHKISKKEHFDFANFMDGFKMGQQIWLLGLVQGIIFGLIAIFAFAPLGVMFFAGFSDFAGFAALPIIGGLVAMVYLGVSWIYSIPIFVFFDVSFWQAMELSRRLTNRNFGAMLLFGLAMFGLTLLGLLALVLGLLVAIPVINISVYTSFVDILHLEEEFEVDLMDHLVDDGDY